jgi:hypothetical protein
MPPGLREYGSLLCVVTQPYAVLYGQNQTTGRPAAAATALGRDPDPSSCRGTQAWPEALSTIRLMTGKRAGTLLELMYRIEYFTLARAWDDLTDAEFFWEPFTMTWSIRRQDQCRTPNPFRSRRMGGRLRDP